MSYQDVRHLCIEPYEPPWLDVFPTLSLVRRPVEVRDINWCEELSSGDFLFIDSSYIIRPDGDVYYELCICPVQFGQRCNNSYSRYFHSAKLFAEWLDDDVKF